MGRFVGRFVGRSVGPSVRNPLTKNAILAKNQVNFSKFKKILSLSHLLDTSLFVSNLFSRVSVIFFLFILPLFVFCFCLATDLNPSSFITAPSVKQYLRFLSVRRVTTKCAIST